MAVTPLLQDVFASFSPRADQFAISSGDGRLKTFDVASGNLCAEFNEISSNAVSTEGHLELEYKCLAWGALPSKKKKRKTLITIGTGGGDVLAWDPIVGELKWRATDCNTGGVNSVCFVKGLETCFCAGTDGMVCELSVESGEVVSKFRAAKTPVTSIALSPDGALLLAASSELKLYDMSTRKRKRKFTGHASSVRATAFTDDGAYALSAAVGERHVALWDCEGSEKGAKVVFTMEHPAVTVDTWGFGKDGAQLKVLAISDVGEAYIWSGNSLEELSKASPLRIRVASKKKQSSKQIVIHGRVTGSDSVLVARGVTAKPSFETVSLGTEDISLPPTKDGTLLTSKPDAELDRPDRMEVTVLGADNAADASMMKARVELGGVKKRKRPPTEEAEAGEPSQNEADAPTTMEEDNDEQTMEERLMALGLLEARPSADNAVQNAVAVVPPKSDSLDLLLTRALRSDDNGLLEHCLSTSDDKVITNTVKTLNPADACTLLQLTIVKLEARPRRALQLLPWIRAALLEHSTFIMSSYSMHPVLTSLYQIIDSRLHTFRPLLALSGRLELIMAKINSAETTERIEDTETGVTAVYEEEESDEDVEDAMKDDDEEEDEEEEGEEDEDEAGEQSDDAMEVDKPLENGGSFSDDDDSDD